MGRRGAGAAILIVEDDAEVRDALTEILRAEGFTVLAADEGRKALELTQIWRPAVILLDLAMEGMDGRAFLEAKRARPTIAEIPVIVMTGSRAAGVQSDVLMVKPLAVGDVMHAVRRLAGHRPGRP